MRHLSLPFVALLALAAAQLTACAAATALPSDVRVRLDARHRSRAIELRYSHFFGELYDDNRKLLLSPYAFADTSHIVDPKGRPIHPQRQLGTVAAGTPFMIEKLEFADTSALATRMLTTPRYNPWVYLRPADTTNLPTDRPMIIVLPMNLDTEEDVEAAMDRVFAPPGTLKPWLEARRPTFKVAIENKDIERGMTTEEMVAAMGPPMLWFTDTLSDKPAQVAWYKSVEIWIQDDLVVERRDGRPEPQGGPAAATTAPAAKDDRPAESAPPAATPAVAPAAPPAAPDAAPKPQS